MNVFRCQIESLVVDAVLLLAEGKFRIPDAYRHENDEYMLMNFLMARSGSHARTSLAAVFLGSSRRRT